MYKNIFKEKLLKNEPVTGCIVQAALPALVEISALAGFDFVFIDAEHGPLSEKDCEMLILAAEARGICPIIRVPQNVPEVILRYMDIGAMGVIIPGLSTAEEAEAVVQAVKYYPRGTRGLSATKSSDYGMLKPMSEYVKDANNETVVMAVIENQKAIDNIAEILAVDGFDAVIIGAGDLSHSMGYPGNTGHPEVEAAFQRALDLGLPSGKPFGAVVRGGEEPKKYFDRGVNMLLTTSFGMLAGASKKFIATVKEQSK